MKVSVIIPALNEEQNLRRCLESLRRFIPAHLDLEILVGDHGSKDATVEVAKAAGARVFEFVGGTVGNLRNRIIANSTGGVIVMLDADTSVTAEWGAALGGVVESLEAEPMQITGSMCEVPQVDNFFIRDWFSKIQRRNPSYLGTGHLITSAALFGTIGGFDPALASGEDVDLCLRAGRAGARVVVRPEMRVIHHDYPLDAATFLRREYWHAKGDFSSLRAIRESRVAQAVLVFAALHLALLGSFLGPGWLSVTVALLLVMYISALSLLKFRMLDPVTRIGNIGIFYLYLIARSGAAGMAAVRAAIRPLARG